MKFPTMFSPIQIGTVTVPNRFVVPPMGNNFANTDGTLSDRSLAYYTARAKGGFGLITIESTVVYEEAKGGPRKPCLFTDNTVESFRKVADACHSYGARVSIQLQHDGPEGNSRLTGYPLKAASRMAAAQGREAELTPADKKKKVVVVGGGPGGLYAAWLCALRGHEVTLLEKEEELGGNFRIAAYPTGKGQLTEVIRSIIVRCQNAGVNLR